MLEQGNIQDEIDINAIDIQLADGTTTSLMGYAALNGAVDIIAHLVALRCHVNEVDGSHRWPAAHAAAQSNHKDCMRLLYKHGCDFERLECVGGASGEYSSQTDSSTELLF